MADVIYHVPRSPESVEYQVPRSTASVDYEVPRPAARDHYDMAAEGTIEIVQQENAYEHMQTLRHIHVDVEESKVTPKSFEIFANSKLRAAILILILSNLAIAVVAIVLITQEQKKSMNLAVEYQDLQRDIEELRNNNATTTIFTGNDLSLIISELNKTKKALDKHLATINPPCNSTGTNASDCENIPEVEDYLLEMIRKLNDSVAENEQKLRNLQASVTGVMGSSIRLTGDSISSGVVEILYNGKWGTICDDGWDVKDANVVCRMRGFREAVADPIPVANVNLTGRIWLTNVACTGDEATIWECEKSDWDGLVNCGHESDVWVECV